MHVHPNVLAMTISTVLRERAGSRWLAWATSVAAIILSVLPGAGSMVHSQLPAYDGSLAVLTATLVALIWYTQFTFDTLAHYRTRDEQERIRARAVLATGVLSELEWLEGRLEQVRLHGPYSDFDPFEHPVLEEILSRADALGSNRQ